MTLDLDKVLKDAEEFDKIRKELKCIDSANIITSQEYRNVLTWSLAYASKNYDSPKIVRQLVDRVKELEAAIFYIANNDPNQSQHPQLLLIEKMNMAKSMLEIKS